MKTKSKGTKSRNLVKRGGVYYYRRTVAGRCIRFSCETGNREVAERRRDLYEAKNGVGIGRVPVSIVEMPRFRGALREGRHRAPRADHAQGSRLPPRCERLAAAVFRRPPAR